MLDRLLELIKSLFDWLPRIHYIEPCDQGVRVTLGSRVRALEPGWWWWCPLFQSIHTTAAVRQTINLKSQFCTTTDGKCLAVSCVVVYRVTDILKAYYETHELDTAIADIAQCGCRAAIERKTSREILGGQIASELLAEVRQQTAGWGVKIIKVDLNSCAPCQMIGLLGDLANFFQPN